MTATSVSVIKRPVFWISSAVRFEASRSGGEGSEEDGLMGSSCPLLGGLEPVKKFS